jgi:ribosomal protein S18 acetylase RimI-like enzyme
MDGAMNDEQRTGKDETGMILRMATLADAQSVADYNVAMALETEHLRLDAAMVLAGVRAVLGDVHKGTYFVAEVEGGVAAQLMVTHEWSDWRNGDIWWIQSVYVHPDFRRRGLFKMLYRHVAGLAKEQGGAGIRLYVERENTDAQRTYVSLGMAMTHYLVMEEIFGERRV